MKPRLQVALLCLGLLLQTPGTVRARPGPQRAAYRVLQTEGRIQQVVTADFDGNGTKDLLLLHVTGQGREARRWASVYWHRLRRRFLAEPDLTWELPRQEAALGVVGEEAADFPPPREESPPPKAQLFALRADGVYRYDLVSVPGQARAERRVRADLGHLVAEAEDVLILDFARYWGAQGLGFLTPSLPLPQLFWDESSAPPLALPVPPDASYRIVGSPMGVSSLDLAIRYQVPLLSSSERDGQGRAELLFCAREQVVRVSLPALDGNPGSALAVARYPIEVLTSEDEEGEPPGVRTRLVDLEGDGDVDVVVTVFRDSGLFEFEGRVMLFRSRADGSFPEQPDQVLRASHGQYYLTEMLDLSGDGRTEILVPTAKLGVWGFIKLLTRRKVSFQFHVFHQDKGGKFGPEPTLRPTLQALVSERYGLSTVALSDVTGDGVRDLVLGAADDRLCLYPGEMTRGEWHYAARPTLCFSGDPFARLTSVDLDGDGRDELLQYGLPEADRSRLRVTFLDD